MSLTRQEKICLFEKNFQAEYIRYKFTETFQATKLKSRTHQIYNQFHLLSFELDARDLIKEPLTKRDL